MVRVKSASDTRPLQFWKHKAQHEFSGIFSLVKMYLSVCASSAQDERSFSCAGILLSATRTSLGAINLVSEYRIRMFINSASDSSQDSQLGRQNRLKACNSILKQYEEWLNSCRVLEAEKGVLEARKDPELMDVI